VYLYLANDCVKLRLWRQILWSSK